MAAQWDSELNGELTPQMVTAGSHKRVWWRCAEGHVWQALIYSRTGRQKSGCPICAGMFGKKRLARMRELENAARRAAFYGEVAIPVEIDGKGNQRAKRRRLAADA